MRLAVVALVALVAGCASPEMQSLRGACQAGNLDACYAAESLEQERRANMSAAFSQAGAYWQQRSQPAYAPPTRTCAWNGPFLNCF